MREKIVQRSRAEITPGVKLINPAPAITVGLKIPYKLKIYVIIQKKGEREELLV